MTACQFETSDRFAVPSSAIELKIWKTVTGTIMLSINHPMQFKSSGKYPTPCFANVDPSVIGESLSCYCCLHTQAVESWGWLIVGRGDNLQLLISPLLKYEEWLYNIIDKNFEINSLEPHCTGGLKIPHTPIGTCINAKKLKFWICFDCGTNVFQWTKKNYLGQFDWNCLGSRYLCGQIHKIWPF